MRTKIFFYLTLVLSGGLTGCSTTHCDCLSVKQQEQTTMTNLTQTTTSPKAPANVPAGVMVGDPQWTNLLNQPPHAKNAFEPDVVIQPEVAEAIRYTLADADLNRAYNELRNGLDQDQQELLRKAELAWIAMRDAQADLAVSRTGGHGRTAGYYSSLTGITQARTRELKDLFTDK
jgi:uncharacterized protein YecT (DUF1311 family)